MEIQPDPFRNLRWFRRQRKAEPAAFHPPSFGVLRSELKTRSKPLSIAPELDLKSHLDEWFLESG